MVFRFEKKYEFPGVIGIVDGSQIGIVTPEEYPQAYINHKVFYAMQAQV